MTSASIMVRLHYERTVNSTSEARLPRNRTISRGMKEPIPDISMWHYQEYQSSRMNYSVVSNGRTANSINQFSNQFIDFSLLLDISSALWFPERTCDQDKSPDENMHIHSCLQMFPRTYTLFSALENNVQKMAWLEQQTHYISVDYRVAESSGESHTTVSND